MKKLLVPVLLLMVGVLVFATPLKVAFIYVGPVGDAGWTYAHDLGRQYVQKLFGDKIQVTYIESVPVGSEAISVLKSLASRGFKLIYTTSFSYMQQTAEVAKQFPNVIFENCSGYITLPNMGDYFGRIYQSEFLTGLIAGAMTKDGKIGYVAAYPIPEVIRGINAFTIGVRMVNPKATVHVVWVNSWYDPATEKEAALSLINAGCDVIKSETDSAAPLQAAEEHHVYAIGYNTDMVKFAPHYYLTSATFNWGKFYEMNIKSVLNGTWKAEDYWGGLDDGVVGLAPMTKLVPPQTKKLVMAMEEEIKNHSFKVFEGPIYDQNGKLKVPAGKTLTDKDLLSMNWFVEGVVGKLPK